MNPNYVHTVTLYRKRDGIWGKTVLHGCFWKSVTNTVQSGEQATVSNTYTVRIPLSSAGDGFSILPGDLAVLGDCQDEISNEPGYREAEVLRRHKPDAFRVTAYSDNTDHLMDKHYRLGG